MPVALEQHEGLCIFHFEGEINIISAAQFKVDLGKALASRAELRLDLERATELDVTALQLLWAAEREACGIGRAFTVSGAIPDGILRAVIEAGLEKFPLTVRNSQHE